MKAFKSAYGTSGEKYVYSAMEEALEAVKWCKTNQNHNNCNSLHKN